MRARDKILIGLAAATLISFLIMAFTNTTPYNPQGVNSSAVLLSPNRAFWFGTDQQGSDILSQTISAAKSGVGLAFIAAFSSALLGTAIGLAAGSGRKGGGVAMRALDLFQSFPLLILALVIAVSMGSGASSVIIAIMLLLVPQFIRLVRGKAIELTKMRFYEAAIAMGSSRARLIFVQLLPNLRGLLAAQFSLAMSQAILAIAALGYLGIGIAPPTPTWGGMVQVGADNLVLGQWWTVLFPGAAIFGSVALFTWISHKAGSVRAA
jgi:peptide/nickel transport system permease protein